MKSNIIIILAVFLSVTIVCCREVDDNISLRKFPFPYIAALSISSDIDNTDTVDEFLEIARFVNTEDSTSMGCGAGMEIGYSFWFFDLSGQSEFTVFRDTTCTVRACEGVIRDFIDSGLIDCLHTYGEFGEVEFRRKFAEHALEYLSDRDETIEVWSNHGGSLNTQQIGHLPYQRGDNPESVEYHADLLLLQGVRFIEKYEITHVVGQDCISSPLDRIKQLYEVLYILVKSKQWRANTIFSNNLIWHYTLDDGQHAYSFRRFMSKWGNISRVGSRNLAGQIAPTILEELKKKNGYMIVYTHLGDNADCTDYVPAETREAMYHLAEEYRNGSIYVTTTRKLLTYNLVSRFLDWDVRHIDDRIEILIEGVRDDRGEHFVPSIQELQGITFYTPAPESTRVYIGGREIKETIVNPPDETGKKSITIPLRRAVFPARYRDLHITK